MKSGARGLSNDKKSTEAGSSVGLGEHAAALVVRSRYDRNGGFLGIMPELEKSFVDEREPFSHESSWFPGNIQIDTACPGFLDFRIDRSGHDISWCEGAPFIVIEGKVLTFVVQQHSALSPQGLRNEEGSSLRAGCGGIVEAGWVELDEFHVRDAGTCSPGHGNAIAGSGVWVCRVKVDLSAATCGKNHPVGTHDTYFTGGLFQNVGADNAIFSDATELIGSYEVNRHVIHENCESRSPAGGFQKGGGNFMARGVLGVQNTSS